MSTPLRDDIVMKTILNKKFQKHAKSSFGCVLN